MQIFGYIFFYLTLFWCAVFIGTPVRFLKTALGDFRFGAIFYVAPGQFLNTASSYFCFAALFYDAPGRNSCEALML